MRVALKKINVVTTYGKEFEDFGIGRGFEDSIGEVRVRLNADRYIHINSGHLEINDMNDWPEPSEPVVIREYKITMEEI